MSGMVAVFSRRLKGTPATVIMFYQGLTGFVFFGIYLVIERIRSESGVRMLSYTQHMFWGMIFATIFNSAGRTCWTIAYQNDRSAFIVLCANIAIVYFFFTDTFVFHESFSVVELVCTLVIMAYVLSVAIGRTISRNKKEDQKGK